MMPLKPTLTMQGGRRRLTWQTLLITLLGIQGAFVGLLLMFQGPTGRAVAVSALFCGLTSAAVGAAAFFLRCLGQPPRLPGCLSALLFVLLGSLGAAWVETVYWAWEKVFGAQGVAAHPNLIVDLLATMPWYVAMVAVLCFVQRRYRYHWTTVALLGVLYETGGDGILGHLLGGNAITPGYLLQLLLVCPGIFLLSYSVMVLPPVWLLPLDAEPYRGSRGRRFAGAFLPLLPLIPYGLIVVGLLG